jgi:HemY protein
MARLEEGEYPQTDRARAWLDRAIDAPPDPVYVCAHCGGESGDWHALCPHCRAFDTLSWRVNPTAARADAGAIIVAVPPPAIAPPLLAAAAQSDK